MTDEKDKNESSSYGTGTGKYIQTYGTNGPRVFILGSEIHNKSGFLMDIVLTKHFQLEGPVQMNLGSREDVKSLYTACKRFLEATEKLE